MKALSRQGRDRLSQYFDRIEEANHLSTGQVATGQAFSVEPTIQQRLIDKQTESTDLLSAINIELVDEIKGEKLGLSLDGRVISSRTNVANADRQTKSVWLLDDDQYECRDTHFDTHLTYAQIDRWAKFPDFEARISKHLVEAQRADRIKIGMNGIAHATTTDRSANPLGQDVNIGWLERQRINNSARVLDSGAVSTEVSFGTRKNAQGTRVTDFANLDALVIALANEMLDSWHVNRTDLVALVGRDLLGDKYFGLYNQVQPPSEILATRAIDLTHQIGRYPAKIVPWMPNGTVIVTYLKNLSIYEQSGSRRRKFEDKSSRSRYDTFESFNEDYVIEDYGAMAMAEKIVELN
jgi:P2 family phage major capsid protein